MPSFVQRWTLLALALTLLSACETGSSDPTGACPPIKEYSREFQDRLAIEIEAAPLEAVWPEVVLDCFMLRSLNRGRR